MTRNAAVREAAPVAGPCTRLASLAGLVLAFALAGCGGGSASRSSTSPPPGPSTADADEGLSPAAQLGRQIFRDKTLSASGQQACISCHDPFNGHASPFATPVAFGGPNLDQPGTRNPPSLRYLRFNASFAFAADGTPTGGFFWDGRAPSLAAQARGPLLAANEMANTDVASIVARLAQAPYAAQFRTVFGDTVFKDPEAALSRATFALERYQREDEDFAPFDSKFDAFTAGRANLTTRELNGLALFNRSDKGNCAACHTSTRPANAPGALFTDFSYDTLGIPRNAAIPANADAAFRDEGLCGTGRPDLATRRDLCGAFKVPSLRNVALRKHFFHNGRFDTLEDVIRFYVQRDTDPQLWYPQDALGNVIPYDDLLAPDRGNVNVTEGPYNRRRGQAPALTEAEVLDIAAFLRTLSDGFSAP